LNSWTGAVLKERVDSLSIVQGGAWQICARLEEVVGKNRVQLSTPVTAIHQVFFTDFHKLVQFYALCIQM